MHYVFQRLVVCKPLATQLRYFFKPMVYNTPTTQRRALPKQWNGRQNPSTNLMKGTIFGKNKPPKTFFVFPRTFLQSGEAVPVQGQIQATGFTQVFTAKACGWQTAEEQWSLQGDRKGGANNLPQRLRCQREGSEGQEAGSERTRSGK